MLGVETMTVLRICPSVSKVSFDISESKQSGDVIPAEGYGLRWTRSGELRDINKDVKIDEVSNRHRHSQFTKRLIPVPENREI